MSIACTAFGFATAPSASAFGKSRNPLPARRDYYRTGSPRMPTTSALSRRDFVFNASAAALAAVLSQQRPAKVNAVSGLRVFPLQERLTNTYYLMRAAESVSDKLAIINSNPVNKLSIQMHGLTPAGVKQAMKASQALEDAGVSSDAWIWPSVAMNAFETAEILAYNLDVRREQIVPEFSFLDARGVGLLEGGGLHDVRRVMLENDRKDSSWRPAAGEDGTPNDSTDDVFVRVRQLLCKLETQYFGEKIVILSPDSDPLSILQTAMLGQDLRGHHEFEYEPGEVRHVKELVVDRKGETIDEPIVRTLSKP